MNNDTQNLSDTSQFLYNDSVLEVVIIDNGDDDRDGYVELNAVTKLLAPIVSIRGFNKSVLWANTLPPQKLVRNNKNYVHVFALCRYFSNLNGAQLKNKSSEYYIFKQLICDLLIGAQSQIVDPLSDIKNQLCNLQQCISANGTTNLDTAVNLYQPSEQLHSKHINYSELRDIVHNEFVNVFSNVSNNLENVKNAQNEILNKLGFSNDTMIDSFKSIKDLIIRKK
ncbi:P24 [Urbanus proteus nucleopolyhedrovirus]|uniref:P24 n=1 Tax=Urbanus proteus nucleopolyhedrovirus TaxID=1675866 RepID=A0A162GV24_9ABAC|nr:P24 [Urbanus proteus nucleopolyhedrovirus]AKR17388.1 P24 [Urbanus proteus nucleopolyhedrovirus]